MAEISVKNVFYYNILVKGDPGQLINSLINITKTARESFSD